jgi:tRNA(Ile)-lysidine synthase
MDLAEFPLHFLATFPELVGRRLLVALSGGSDSVALLHLLGHPDLNLELEAVHVHHGTRGAEADADAAFCEELCRELGIPFHLRRISAGQPMPAGREGTWRELRYRVLFELMEERKTAAVATGHHLDDVAEGVLVQLMRGGGPRALAGIATTTPTGVVRPLLPWPRSTILAWLEHRRMAWREDSSNLDLGLLRNKIRHEILPILEQTSPSLCHHLVHLAKTLGADEAFLATELAARASWIDPWEPDGGVALIAIRDLPPPLRTRWLHAQADRIGLDRVTRRQTELFEELIATGQPRAVTLGRRWRIRLANHQLWLEPPQPPQPFAFDLVVGETIELPLPGWRVRFGPRKAPPDGLRWSYHPPPGVRLTIRSQRTGDRIEIDDARVRVSRILARAMPRHLRWAWPVVCEDDRIYWIPGVWQGPEASDREGPVVEVTRS